MNAAETACRDYAKSNREIKRLTSLVSDELSKCAGVEPQNAEPLVYQPGGTHLASAYAPQDEDEGPGRGIVRSWLHEVEKMEIISACPHCLAAHIAIQDRKSERQKLGVAKRRITQIGKAYL